jgi:hypothetical protein
VVGNPGKHLLTEEGELECWEDTLCRIDQDPVLLKLVEERQ